MSAHDRGRAARRRAAPPSVSACWPRSPSGAAPTSPRSWPGGPSPSCAARPRLLRRPETRSARSCGRDCTSSPRSSAARRRPGTWPRPAATSSPAHAPTRRAARASSRSSSSPTGSAARSPTWPPSAPRVSVPVLAKEFVVDRRQLPMLRAAGADLVLLLAALHRVAALRSLVRAARDLGLEPLVEAHDRRELDRAPGDRSAAHRAQQPRPAHAGGRPGARRPPAAEVPDDRLVVAESGVREPATVAGWRAVGFDAALIGEALMRRATTRPPSAPGRPPSWRPVDRHPRPRIRPRPIGRRWSRSAA